MKLNLIFLATSCLLAVLLGLYIIWLNAQKAQVINPDYSTKTIIDN